MSKPATKARRRAKFPKVVRRRQKVKAAKLKVRRMAMRSARRGTTQGASLGATTMDPNETQNASGTTEGTQEALPASAAPLENTEEGVETEEVLGNEQEMQQDHVLAESTTEETTVVDEPGQGAPAVQAASASDEVPIQEPIDNNG